jgi:outer membrane protein OmpA-like peptidoglycan-associated protein
VPSPHPRLPAPPATQAAVPASPLTSAHTPAPALGLSGPGPRRRGARRVAAVALVLGAGLAAVAGTAGPASADPNPPPTAGEPTATAPVAIDATSPDLRLPEGATLAPPKVLDIVSVTDQSSVAASRPEQRQETSNSTVTYALQAELLFAKDSAKLSPAAASRIAAIAGDINARHVTSPIRVFGFTDDLGSSEHGDVLSKQRADAVYAVLASELGKLGDASHTFQVRGYGEDYPIADNSTESGRRQNRRVEITFTPPGA